jgi:large subunit ribosomal protein L19e
MKLAVQKRLAASVLKCSAKRVHFASERLSDIKEAITKADIRGLVNDNVITKTQEKGVSRARANHRADQRRKGLQRGTGKRKAKPTATLPRKDAWMSKIRAQRKLIAELKEKDLVTKVGYKELYRKSKGGFFRNRRHIKLYIDEHNLAKQKE